MKLFRMSQILDFYSTPETRNIIQRRIIYLATKRIVLPDEFDRGGAGSVRKYSWDKVYEIGLALKLMELSIGTEIIRRIIDKWQEERGDKDEPREWAQYIVYIPRSMDDDRPEKETILVLAQGDQEDVLKEINSINDCRSFLLIDFLRVKDQADFFHEQVSGESKDLTE